MANYYLGTPNNLQQGMTSMFGRSPNPSQPPQPTGPFQESQGPVLNPANPTFGRVNPGQPLGPFGMNGAAPGGGTAVRPTGPSHGFDSSYLQNLATSTGGMFAPQQGSNLVQFNPLGNLTDINTNPLGFGNAPLAGLPTSYLQQAQQTMPTPPSPTAAPPAPAAQANPFQLGQGSPPGTTYTVAGVQYIVLPNGSVLRI